VSTPEKLKDRGKRLAQARRNAKLTQRKVAERLGVEHSTVSRWEAGEAWPVRRSLEAVLKLYDASEQEILFGEGAADSAAMDDPPYAAWPEFLAWLESRPERQFTKPWMLENLRKFRCPPPSEPTVDNYKALLFPLFMFEGDTK
jgi:transcriptional regulator with XRE-family HTH domain